MPLNHCQACQQPLRCAPQFTIQTFDVKLDKSFQQAVLAYYQEHGRKHLPWQQSKSPYRVWVSEIMLQQTQVATVIPYYEKFMQRFATIESLAHASVDEVLSYWSGLGYYSRARNLHQCAKTIVEQFDGAWPSTVAGLESLPGIGRSTAGAILSLSMQQPAAILDGNVKRVLCRVFAINGWPGSAKVLKQLWELSERLTPEKNTDQYNQAMMDLGATVCTRSKPTCNTCPLKSLCNAQALGAQKEYPFSKPKKEKPTKHVWMPIIVEKNQILLEKRPPTGIWGGLWSLPEFDSKQSLQFAFEGQTLQWHKPFKHTFSHYHLMIQAVEVNSNPNTVAIMDSNARQWHHLTTTENLGLPAPIEKLLKPLRATL